MNDGGKFRPLALVVLAGLLVLPCLAVHRRGIDWRWAVAYGLGISAVSYGVYAVDKRRARAQEWRVSEGAMHLTELLGGWPGAFVAQRRLRHKCAKGGFQFTFWLIVLAYQFAAFDSMRGWQYSLMVLKWIDGSRRGKPVTPFRNYGAGEGGGSSRAALKLVPRMWPNPPPSGNSAVNFTGNKARVVGFVKVPVQSPVGRSSFKVRNPSPV